MKAGRLESDAYEASGDLSYRGLVIRVVLFHGTTQPGELHSDFVQSIRLVQ